jgi:hypothetical protein
MKAAWPGLAAQTHREHTIAISWRIKAVEPDTK